MRLKDRIALVTGGAQGIGLAIARRLAGEGADIMLNVHKDDDRAREAIAALRATGRRAELTVADVSRPDETRRMVAEGVAAFGRLDALVNNAGVEHHADFLDVEEADYDRTLGVNLKGMFFATQAFARHCRDAGHGGRVVTISSVHEELPFPHFAPYCASKGGAKMLTRTLSVELAPLGITLNNIAPGAVRTPINDDLVNDQAKFDALLKQIPLGRLGSTDDVAGAAAFLCSDDAAYMTGTTLTIDGGLTWDYHEQ